MGYILYSAVMIITAGEMLSRQLYLHAWSVLCFRESGEEKFLLHFSGRIRSVNDLKHRGILNIHVVCINQRWSTTPADITSESLNIFLYTQQLLEGSDQLPLTGLQEKQMSGMLEEDSFSKHALFVGDYQDEVSKKSEPHDIYRLTLLLL